jgi:hypothetical protein
MKFKAGDKVKVNRKDLHKMNKYQRMLAESEYGIVSVYRGEMEVRVDTDKHKNIYLYASELELYNDTMFIIDGKEE